MKHRLRSKLALAIGGVAAALACFWTLAAINNNQNMDKVQTTTQQMKTVCVGRLLIDVPEDAQVVYRPASIAGVVFSAAPNSSSTDLASNINEVRQLLTGSVNAFDSPSLEREAEVHAVNFKATVMYYDRKKPSSWLENGKRVSSGEQAITVEAIGLKEDTLYHFKAVDLASPKFEKNVEQLLSKFDSRRDDIIPTERGFCAERALVHDPIPADDFEQVTVFIALKGHPDVAIRLDTAVQAKSSGSLLERDANNQERINNPSLFTSLRKGARVLNGIAGEEVIYRSKEANGTTSRFAMWASQNKVDDVMSPAITLEIEAGKGKRGDRVNASLSDEALLHLWDKVSGSLRIRPTSAASRRAETPPVAKLPLGELVSTEQPCPQTGYWQCTEVGIVEGGQRRFFTENNTMPEAVLRGAPSLWQKRSGVLPSYRVSTVWKLVAYEESSSAPTSADKTESHQLPSEPDNDQGAT